MREALVYAIGIALSPVAIAAVLLLLTCRRAVANAVGFLAGWTIGVATLFFGFVVIVGKAGLTDSDPLWIAVAELALGTVFLVATMLLWKRRHRRSELDASWVAAVDSFTTARWHRPAPGPSFGDCEAVSVCTRSPYSSPWGS